MPNGSMGDQSTSVTLFQSPEESVGWKDAMGFTTPSTSVTSPPIFSDTYSNFGEIECGEPSKPQSIRIDFTPIPEIDTPEAQKKCCDFWDYINQHPCLKKLRIEPDPTIDFGKSTPSSETVISETPEPNAYTVLEKDSVVHFNLAFSTKLPLTECMAGPREYIENELTTEQKPDPKMPPCTCKGKCSKCLRKKITPLKALSRELNTWDRTHPKSYNPPGPIKDFRPIMQRRIPPPQEVKTCLEGVKPNDLPKRLIVPIKEKHVITPKLEPVAELVAEPVESLSIPVVKKIVEDPCCPRDQSTDKSGPHYCK